MTEELQRTAMLYGETAVRSLADKRVAVFGLGGVGGYAIEALARSGIGTLDLIDHDHISVSNRNRQILATAETVGQFKVEAAKKRILAINPACRVHVYPLFYLNSTTELPDFQVFDYVIDAIDTVTGKLLILESCRKAGVPVISVMGTGNKTDLTKLCVTDLYSTSVCPLARVMRRECKARGIPSVTVVYSPEKPVRPVRFDDPLPQGRRSMPGSNAFVPAAAGLLAAQTAVNTLLREAHQKES